MSTWTQPSITASTPACCSGELFAGIPDDVRALAVAGKRDEAYEVYARRYDLSLDRARRVVDANT